MMIMASGTVCRIDRNRASAASRANAIADCLGSAGCFVLDAVSTLWRIHITWPSSPSTGMLTADNGIRWVGDALPDGTNASACM